MAKQLSREQVQVRKAKEVLFTENVLDDPERADEIEDESLESYAERRGFALTNPAISPSAGKAIAELVDGEALLGRTHKKRKRKRTDNPGDGADAPTVMEVFGREIEFHGRERMATKQDLLDQIKDLQDENQDLQDRLDAIADLVNPEDENGDETDEDDDDNSNGD